MNLQHPIIAVIGSGAMGGYYGGRLAQHGFDVHFLLRSDYAAVKQRGWTVHSCHGDFTLPPSSIGVYDDARKMPKADLVLVTLKTTANDQFDTLISPLIKDDTAILTLQNGLGNEERLAELFGAQRILGGTAFIGVQRAGPGVIRHLEKGFVRLGDYNAPPSARTRRVAEMFNASKVECEVVERVRDARWEKLVWNIPFNGLGAALDQTTDRLLATPEATGLVRELMSEVVAIARADGSPLPANVVQQNIDITLTVGALRTSMQIDRQEGRAMEVESIVGEPCWIARGHGVNAPILSLLYRMLAIVNHPRS
jgi:2-dehydropantoate 2-reductase